MENKISKIKRLEQMLLRRLLFIGGVMVFFGSFIFTFAILSYSFNQENELSAENIEVNNGTFATLDLPFLNLTEVERRNSYIVAAIFVVLGTSLIIISKKRNRGWNEEENSNR